MKFFTWLFGAKKPKATVTPMFPNHVRDVRYSPTHHSEDYADDYRRNNNDVDDLATGILLAEAFQGNDDGPGMNIDNGPAVQSESFDGFGGGDFGGGGSGGSFDDSPSTDSSSFDSGSSYDSGSSSNDY